MPFPNINIRVEGRFQKPESQAWSSDQIGKPTIGQSGEELDRAHLTFYSVDGFLKWLVEIGEFDHIDAVKSFAVPKVVMERLKGDK